MPIRLLSIALLATACGGSSAPPKTPQKPLQESVVEQSTDDGMVDLGTADLRGVVIADIAHQPRPVIIAMHGLGDHPTKFSQLTRGWADIATIVVPAAPTPYHDGFSWFPVSGRKDTTQLAAAVAETARRVVQLVNARRNKGVPVVVTGFSQGGMLSFALATQHPQVIDGAVPVGGFLPKDLWPDKKPDRAPTIIALHGSDDPIIPVEAPLETIRHLDSLGWTAAIELYDGVGHSIPGPMRSDLDDTLSAMVRAAEHSP